MSKTPTAQQVGEAVLLLASLFNGGVAVAAPQPAKTEPGGGGSPSTAGANTAADTTKVDGNSQGLDQTAFTKLGLDFAKADKGVKLKGILAGYGVERLGEIKPEQYDEFLGKIEEAKLA